MTRTQEKLRAGQKPPPQKYTSVGGRARLSQSKKDQILRFTWTRFTLSDALELLFNQFDQYVLEECQHFLRDQAFMAVMRDIQSVSAMIVFVMIHVPLTKISSMFSLLTAVIPVILDKKNKEHIYLSTYSVSRAFDVGVPDNLILRKSSNLQEKFKYNRY